MRPLLSWLLPLVIAAVPASGALAQAYPSRPITLAIPFSSGSNVEILIRAMSVEVSAALGQPVVVESRAGANLRLPILALRKSPPDGYFLAGVNDALMVTQTIADPGFKLETGKDFAPVAFLMSFPLVVAAHPAQPYRDIKGLVDYAKANPGKINFGGGAASITQTTSERMRTLAGADWAYIPYKEGGLVMPDLLQGRIHLTISGSLLKPGMDAGKLVGIATTGQSRWSLFPNLPTLQESGLNMFAITWYGIVAPAGTPADIVKRLNAAYNAAIKTPNIEKRLNEFGMSPGYPAPEQFDAFVRSEVVSWTPIIKASGIRFD